MLNMSTSTKSKKNPINILSQDGEAYFYPEFFAKEESDLLFESLLQDIAWKQEPIFIFGKKIMQPRLTAWYGDDGTEYSYSGIHLTPLPWNKSLLLIKDRIEEAFGIQFNSALLNQYRNEQDSMGWHRDDEKELGKNPVICSVSFGATRTFQFKHIEEKDLKTSVELSHGSALLMAGSTQHHWAHALPKRAGLIETRINITFRTIKS